jgi:hypothetical protein
MPDDIIITNGGEIGGDPPLARLVDPNGNIVAIPQNPTPAKLLEVWQRVVGPMPTPAEFGAPGAMEVTGIATDAFGNAFPTSTYNPGNDVINQGIAQEYSAYVASWTQHAQSVQAMIVAIMDHANAAKTLTKGAKNG